MERLARLGQLERLHPCSETRESDVEFLLSEHRDALALVIEIHEKLGYLPTWTRTAGEIADWYRKATAFLGPRAILDPVKQRIRGA